MRHATIHRHLANERGATLPFVALCLVMLLSMAALAVDYGMLVTARAAAQRAADSGALAGASAYVLEETAVEDTAYERALDYTTRNRILNRDVPGEDVRVWVNHDSAQVTVHVRRDNLPTFFARVFDRAFVNVAAFATARVTDSGTAACIKPFGIPDTLFAEEDFGTVQKIWEQKDDEENMALVAAEGAPPGTGNYVYQMLVDTTCAFNISTGSHPYRAPDDTRLGQVRNGFNTLISYDPDLTWSPDGPYDGFNRADWPASPRVATIPVYDPATSNAEPGGTGTLNVTGFITVFMSHTARTSPPQPHDQVYAVVLRATGVTDTCSGQGCSNTTKVLQLIR